MMETVKQSDEEYVRGVWGHPWVYEGNRKLDLKLQYPVHFEGATKDGMGPLWSAAAAYTRERLEEVRQLREEIAMVNAYISFREKTLESGYTPVSFAEHVAEHLACFRRILTRLEAILADKLTGMKAGGA